MQVSFISSIADIDCSAWNAITGTDYPFTRHEFLLALENSGATTHDSGWEPQHLLLHDGDQLVAVMPLYLKHHSYGEYVFDWSWADAYRRNGLAYYPKLLSAIPFTPATGQRLCVKNTDDFPAICGHVANGLLQHAQALDLSSIHILFPLEQEKDCYQQLDFPTRCGTQFHWFNQGFSSFDDFLETFSSRKRKNLRKERRRVTEQNLRLEVIEGSDISPEIWQRFYYFYQLTYAKRSGHGGYLEQPFFEEIARTMAEHLVLVLAYDDTDQQAIAGALNFRSSDTLYGRYWGCIREYEYLHFEACYYQGIDYCIAKGLQRFDPGAQGEHKIQRGFAPTETWSNHWIAHPAFKGAIDDFLQQDNAGNQHYMQQARSMLPFKASQYSATDVQVFVDRHQ